MNVQCSWKVSDGRPISDAIFYNRDTQDADLEDEINVENCVFLKAPDQSEGLYPSVPACQLLICCEPPNQITRISAICEARVIEIYGHHGEYLKTVFNYPLEETENLFVYRGDVELKKPLSVCSVKFVNLESPNEMWLFGVKIHTDKTTYSPLQNNPIAAVQQQLDVMKDGKGIFKQFANNLLKMGLSSSFPQLPMEQPKSTYWYNAAAEQTNNNLMDEENSKISSNEVQVEKNDVNNFSLSGAKLQLINSNGNNNTVSASTSPVIFLSESTATQTYEDYGSLEGNLKNYIDGQIQAINKRFLEMEAKILCKLDEIESFVKPHGIVS